MSGDPFDLIGQVVGGQFPGRCAGRGRGPERRLLRCRRLDGNVPVAIKCLYKPDSIPGPLARAMDAAFLRACRVHDRLARGNPNIAQTITSGETRSPRNGTSVPYLVREWLEGQSLAAELAARDDQPRPLRPLDEVLGLLKGAFEAIAFAHAQGEVHLGINPGNLFVVMRADGGVELKVLDFGLARMMNDFSPETPAESHSGQGLRLLLPGYAAPEQLDETVGVAGPRTDVYALALVAMEALSGHTLPPLLEQALDRALSPAPDARQANAGELWNEVREFAAPSPGATSLDADPLPAEVEGGIAEPRPKAPSQPSNDVQPEAPERELHASMPVPAVVHATDAAMAPAPLIEPNDPLRVHPSKIPSLVPPVLTLSSGAPSGSRTWRLPPLPSRRVLAFAGTATVASMILVAGTVAALRSHPASGSIAPPAVSDFSAQSPSVNAPSPGAPSAGSPGGAPPAASQEAPSHWTTSGQAGAAFAPAAARRALDARKSDVGKCRGGPVWGNASATVTFANDGSVDKVAIAPPFAGTKTGACAEEALATARVATFGGAAGSVTYRFYLARR